MMYQQNNPPMSQHPNQSNIPQGYQPQAERLRVKMTQEEK